MLCTKSRAPSPSVADRLCRLDADAQVQCQNCLAEQVAVVSGAIAITKNCVSSSVASTSWSCA